MHAMSETDFQEKKKKKDSAITKEAGKRGCYKQGGFP